MIVQRVVIIGTDRPQPIYHKFGKVVAIDRATGAVCERSTPGAIYVAQTQCGRVEQPWRWWAAHLRREHADMFARPCRTCFPEARR